MGPGVGPDKAQQNDTPARICVVTSVTAPVLPSCTPRDSPRGKPSIVHPMDCDPPNAVWRQQMKAPTARGMYCSACIAILLALAFFRSALPVVGRAATDKQNFIDKGTAPPPDETNAPEVTLPATSTPEDRNRQAWSIPSDAIGDTKHAQTRIQALAALGLLRSPRSSKMILEAMADPDVDVRTAAVLAAGETKDRNLTTPLRNLLDDKEPQVDFTAAMTLWKMNDKSGEDILMSVVAGDRSANPTMVRGTEHKINKDLHDPAMLAKMGAMQGAIMLLGPFGYGITAFQFMHQSGGNLARASAIEQLSQEKIEPDQRKYWTSSA